MRPFFFAMFTLGLLVISPLVGIGQDASDSYKSFFHQIRTDSVLSFKSSKGYVPSLFNNLGQQAVSPFHLSKKGWLNTAGVAVATAVLIHYDEKIDVHFKPIKEENKWIDQVSPYVTELGDYYGYALLTGFGCYSIAFHNYKAFRTSLLASQAAITAGLWIRVGKILTGRMRPGATYTDLQYNSDHWFGPFAQFQKKYNDGRGAAAFDAIPSGHTGAAFAMATVFSEQYKNVKAVPIVMYSLAGVVGVTRLIEHEHWASDVLLGAVVGYLCGKQVMRNEKRLFPERKTSFRKIHKTFTPVFGSNYNGFRLSFSLN